MEDNTKTTNIKINIDVDTTEVERKIERLTSLLKEAKSLADDLASQELLLKFNV